MKQSVIGQGGAKGGWGPPLDREITRQCSQVSSGTALDMAVEEGGVGGSTGFGLGQLVEMRILGSAGLVRASQEFNLPTESLWASEPLKT